MANYVTAPLFVTAEQFLATTDVMNVATLLQKMTDYGQTPPVATGQMQSLVQLGLTYTVNAGDWVVIGPGVEAVYTQDEFSALFTSSSFNSMTAVVGPDSSDPSIAQLYVWMAGASGTLTITWGDGSPDQGPISETTSGSNAPTVFSHQYPSVDQRTYTLFVAWRVGTTLVNTVVLKYTVQLPVTDIETTDTSDEGPL